MWVYFFGLPQYNVLVLGLDNSGKSTFLYQVGKLCDRKKKAKQKQSPPAKLALKKRSSDQFDPDDMDFDSESKHNDNDPQNHYQRDPKLKQILPTMGQNVKRLDFDNMSLQFWDLPGQQSFRRIWTNYYSEAHAIVFMVDSADTDRLKEARYELHKLLNEYALRNAPFLVLANKQDMEKAVDYQSIINALQLTGCSSMRSSLSTNHSSLSSIQMEHNSLSPIDESSTNNADAFKGRSVRVMCTCCLNKEGLSDAISWLVYTIPTAEKRVEYVAQYKMKEQEQKVK